MKVTHKNVDALNAVLTVEIAEEDYKEKVETALNNYRKTANIPGFRKGKVPAGLIRRQYYKPLTIDEVNKLLQDSVFKYISEEKLDVLGNPLPVEQTDIDWDNQTEFSFDFELGLAPEIDVTIPKKAKLTYNKVVADDKMVNDYVEDITRRYGKMSAPEKAEEGDMFNGSFVEVDAEGNAVEGGIEKDASFMGSSITDKKVLKSLLSVMPGDHVTIDVKKSFREGFNVASILGTTDAKLEASEGLFTFTLNTISRLEPHAIDQELFDKVFGEGNVTSEEDFRAKLKEQAEGQFIGQTDSDFFHHAHHYFLDNVKFDLPETFLKKWMRTAGEKPLTEEEVEADFPKTLDGLRWQLIENRIIKENNLSVSEEELMAFTKQMVGAQMAQYGQAMPEEEMDNIAKNVLNNREEAQRLNDQVYNQKLVNFFKESFKIDYKEMTFDEFVKHQAEHKH